MIVHRGEIDFRSSNDVAQRDLAKAALGVQLFGGIDDRGPGVVRRHFIGPMREMPGRCNLNNCMKLSFEAGECQCADGAMALRQPGLEPQPQDLAARLVLRMTDGGETVPAIISSSKM